MTKHIYEFLYRGRPASSSDSPAYHLVLADDGVDAFGRPFLALSMALTPEQAKANGFDLPKIIAEINAALMTENVRLRGEIEALREAVSN